MQRSTFSKPTEAALRQRLQPLEFEVTQRGATEPPFHNRYWDNHEAGLYVDVVSGEALFSSTDKFDSGTGWPSFSAPIQTGSVVKRPDLSIGAPRTEIRSSLADSHLGHVFNDGPAPSGLRYCINSAALRFIPKAQLAAEGYESYLALFDSSASSSAAADVDASTDNSCSAPAKGTEPGCKASLEIAYLSGGCFWGMQEILRKVPGVVETQVGYMGGNTKNPTYEDVHLGTTGHAESVRVTFEPSRLTYSELLEKWFFRMHDPTTSNRQGNDVGTQYRSAIFVISSEQRATAEAVMKRIQAAGLWPHPLVTEIAEAGAFTPAEEYHQDYLEKHPGGYSCHYLR
jgi:peptide methionine sulfoxide reductase msrA/msrB